MIPPAFASEKLLARLNVLAVACTLAACTAAVFGCGSFTSGWAVGIPTLIVGAIWATALRVRRTIGGTSVRWGWLASIPLAALNAGFSCAAMFLSEESGDPIRAVLAGVLVGATFGIFIWAPALIATLVCFGVPIAWAQRLAAKGLAGTERGERLIGAACVVLGLGALALTRTASPLPLESFEPQRAELFASGRTFAAVLAAAGIGLGTIAVALATIRERRRSRFVARVEAGELAQFRVEPTPEGKVLLRVENRGAGAYRVASYEEEVCLLDAENHATEVRSAMKC